MSNDLILDSGVLAFDYCFLSGNYYFVVWIWIIFKYPTSVMTFLTLNLDNFEYSQECQNTL